MEEKWKSWYSEGMEIVNGYSRLEREVSFSKVQVPIYTKSLRSFYVWQDVGLLVFLQRTKQETQGEW